MDLTERDKFGLEKRNEDHLNYHTSGVSSEWQFNHQTNPSSTENPMNSSSSPCPSVSMVDSLCSNLYNKQTDPQNPIVKPLPMGWNPSLLPPSLSHIRADSGFIERAVRFSCFNGGDFSSIVSNHFSASEPLISYPSSSRGVSDSQSPIYDQRDNNGSNNDSGKAEFSGDEQDNSSPRENGTKKRKRTNQDKELDPVQGASPLSAETTKENLGTKPKGEQKNSIVVNEKPSGKDAKDGGDRTKEDYIHVRARRGQATNSHSLAERVRREKISERMKFLQDLVPGCSKVTGKAVMLDEIINYVQSLQRQVEFLSMKLATVNPRLDFNIEGLLSKDLIYLRGGSSPAAGFSQEMIHTQLHPLQQGLVQAGMSAMGNPSDALRRAINAQLTSLTGYKEPLPQMPNAWEDELHNVVQVNFGSNSSFDTQELNAKPRDGFSL